MDISAEINQNLAQIADDARYQAEPLELETEVMLAQWQALQLAESEV